MIIEGFNICNRIAAVENKEYDLIKAVNDTIFKKLKEAVLEADKIIIKLPEFGTWYYRKVKLEARIAMMLRDNDYQDNEEKLKFLNKLQVIEKQYIEYSSERINNKYKKYGKENYEAYSLALKQKKVQKS